MEQPAPWDASASAIMPRPALPDSLASLFAGPIGADAATALPASADHVVVIGGGFSGTLFAINLLKQAGPRVTLIERRPSAARGAAYSTEQPAHLLNVRAANMSAFPDDPGHFAHWLADHGQAPDAFVSRQLYGRYLAELLAAVQPRDRFHVVRDEAVDLAARRGSVQVTLRSGAVIFADSAALALGNLPPHAPPGIDAERLPPDLYRPDPWTGDMAAGLSADDTILLFGTGLTAVDAVLTLEDAGFTGRIVALSRRGLLPRVHGEGHAAGRSERPTGSLSALLADVRRRAEAIGWRGAIDELRPWTQGLWQRATPAERARFLRHLRPWWDVHRHRLAPAVAARIEALRGAGRLEIVAGQPLATRAVADGVELTWRPRGSNSRATLRARRIVNCTGPGGDLARTPEPLLRRLTEAGVIRPDPLRLGIDVDGQGHVVGRDGRANPRLLALGPMTRGAFWEITAVPDIRRQVWHAARRLCHSHWVADGL